MATDVSPTTLRGLIVHDPRIKNSNLSDAESSYTQSDPLPGVPEDQNTPRSAMTFVTSGTQSASKELRIQAHRGGYPGIDSRGAGLIWLEEGDTEWRGWDVPNQPTGFEFLSFVSNAVTTESQSPNVIKLINGTILACFRYAATGAGDDVVRVYSMTPGSAWALSASVTPTVQHPDLYPVMLQLPDESVLLFCWVTDTISLTAQLQVYRSTDNGATWAVASRFALVEAIDQSASGAGSTGFDLGRMSVAYSNGQICLAAQLDSRDTGKTNAEVIYQWASDDEGASFSLVTGWVADTANGKRPQLVSNLTSGVRLVYIDPVDGGLYTISIGSAFAALDVANETEITQPDKGVGLDNMALWRDDDSTLYLLFNQPTGNNGATVIRRSTDDGENWTSLFSAAGSVLTDAVVNFADSSTYLRDYSAVSINGRGVLVSMFASNPGAYDDASIAVVYLGGASSVTMPSIATFRRDLNQKPFTRTWLPIEEPGDVGWTRTVSGTPTDTLGSTGLTITTGASERLFYSKTAIGTTLRPIGVQGELTVISGGSLSSRIITIELRSASSAADYEVHLQFTTTGFRVMDANGAAQVGSDVSVDMTAGVQIRAGINGAKFACWYRLTGTKTDTDRLWTAGPTTATLTNNSGSPAGSGAVTWGHQLDTGSHSSRWEQLEYFLMASTEIGWEGGQTNPDELFSRPVSRYPLGIDDGVKVSAVDGPAYDGQNWNIDTRYGYPVGNIDPEIAPSPRRRWRSTNEVQHDLAWDLQGLTADTRFGSTSIGLYLGGINWRSGSLWGKANGGSWIKLMDLDAASGQSSLAYVRIGDTIVPNTGGSVLGEHFLGYDEFAGGSFALSGSVIRKIERHTEGSFTNQTTRRPTLFLTGAENGDPTSGDGDIWSPNLVAFIHNLGEYRYLKLTIDAQTTADGYFEIGALALGPLFVFGPEYSWGRSLGLDTNVELTTARDGSRFSHKLGPARRRVSFSWAEGVDTTAVEDVNAVPDYYTGTPLGQPISTANDIPMKMEGLLRELDSAPVVYCPKVPRGTPNTAIDVRRHSSMFGRIVSPVNLESVVGDEQTSEVFRLLNVEIEEEV